MPKYICPQCGNEVDEEAGDDVMVDGQDVYHYACLVEAMEARESADAE